MNDPAQARKCPRCENGLQMNHDDDVGLGRDGIVRDVDEFSCPVCDGTGLLARVSAEQLLSLAPSNHVVVTLENRAKVSHHHAHSFTEIDRLKPGDMVWAPYSPGGNHLVTVWLSEQRAGLGRNGHELVEGALAVRNRRLVVIRDDGVRFDLTDGSEVRE